MKLTGSVIALSIVVEVKCNPLRACRRARVRVYESYCNVCLAPQKTEANQ